MNQGFNEVNLPQIWQTSLNVRSNSHDHDIARANLPLIIQSQKKKKKAETSSFPEPHCDPNT